MVCVRTVLERHHPAEKRAAVRSANAGRRETLVESHSGFREPIDIRSMTRARAIAAHARAVLIVRHEDENIRALRSRGCA